MTRDYGSGRSETEYVAELAQLDPATLVSVPGSPRLKVSAGWILAQLAAAKRE